MFVQSAAFVESHRKNVTDISIYGQEKIAETIRLCQMNLAVHGLSGDIRDGNFYYEDIHRSLGKFDFVMANPPFNVDKIDKERLKEDRRYPFGLPNADNGKSEPHSHQPARRIPAHAPRSRAAPRHPASGRKPSTWRRTLRRSPRPSCIRRSQLTEEELVIFDLLTKPSVELTKPEERDVKRVAKTLLETLKREKLVLDWRKQQTTRAGVRFTIETVLDELPRAYSKEIYEQKCDSIYQHFYDSYRGQGQSLYEGRVQ
jgi:hypothetical protein